MDSGGAQHRAKVDRHSSVGELVGLDRLGPALVEVTGDAAWLDASVELISGGKSNLTFTVASAAGELIVRRPPTGGLLPSAHDMGREARIQQALAGTEVPVPRIVLQDDGDLIGVPCYVMEKVPGHVIRGALPEGYATTPTDREAMSMVFVDTLASLHQVDYISVGLGDCGRPAGFMERQVRRWTSQWEASHTHPVPEIDELARLLAKQVPAQQRHSIVHGDYRTDNVIYDLHDPGRITAVLDWELSTLGDPLSDVALLMLYWQAPEDPEISLIPRVSHLPGFPDRNHMLERYATQSGADLSEMAFYQAFAHFKFAVITQGVAARSAAGAMGGQDFGNLDHDIHYLGHRGLSILQEH